jgi:hypothetical protein
MPFTTSKLELIVFLFLTIFLFDDFNIEKTKVTLVLKSNFTLDNVRSVIQFYLSLLNNLTKLEFYFAGLRDDKSSLELRCNSDEDIISKLENEITFETRHLG